MPLSSITAMVFALLIAGCALTRTSTPSAIPEPPAMAKEPVAAPVATQPAAPAPPPVAPSAQAPVRLQATPDLTVVAPPVTASPVEVIAAPSQPAPVAETTKKNDAPKAIKPVIKPPTTPVAIAPAVASPPRAPPLALATLEQRLKDTRVIGVFTKLTLKNQIDELLERFREHYAGQGSATLLQLRQSYDQLLQKVHGLLKDGDPALASAIANSREAIWSVLTDPVKFAKL